MSTNRWSEPAENLLAEKPMECDVLVIGSGYGGSIAAAQLADGKRTVWVLERGREYALGEFPQDIGQLPGHVRLQREEEDKKAGPPKRDDDNTIGTRNGLFDIRSFKGGAVLLGSGLGGGSLINAGVALQPPHSVFRNGKWPKGIADMKDSDRDALFAEARKMLGAAPLPGAEQLPKFKALNRLARSMNTKAVPVPITVAGTDLPANADRPVDLNACIKCGNCFTGCNYGAKRTLATNLIPDAVSKGARFFTGAQVKSIEELNQGGGARFRVHYSLAGERIEEDHVVDAHTVIVSAGTLGSTELLMRSDDAGKGPLPVSKRLGHGFSGNGDAIAMGWAQTQPVRAFARATGPDQCLEVGPTITGAVFARVKVGNQMHDALIEDGAVPQALGRSAVALGSTLSLFHRYLGEGKPGFFDHHPHKDWVATPAAIRDHTQLLLAMGADEADGKLEWKNNRLSVEKWPGPVQPEPTKRKNARDKPPADFQEGVHAWFRQAGRRGFDDGDYITNPMWRPLPDDFAEVAGEGAQVGGRITVHPLGGCGMGHAASDGVVDEHGTVFRPNGGVYAGLHVLDGSIIPCATVANPMLTISAIALRAAREIDRQLRGGAAAPVSVPVPIPRQQPRAVPGLLTSDDGGVTLGFRETLVAEHCRGDVLPPWVERLLASATKPVLPEQLGKWVAVVEVDIAVDDWLEDPSRALPAAIRLWASKDNVGLEVDPALFEDTPLLQGEGEITLLALDAPNLVESIGRLLAAMRCFAERRPGEADIWGTIRNPAAALATALNHTWYRELRYTFQVKGSGSVAADQYSLSGTKKLAYAPGEKNLWKALTQLPLEMRRRGSWSPHAVNLDVDLVDMIKNRRLQITSAPNTPAAIVGLAAFAAQWARGLVQSHFWTFRGLDYDKLPAPPEEQEACQGRGEEMLPPPCVLEGVARHTIKLPVPRSRKDPGPIDLELHRYQVANPKPDRCVLLIHGLAHGTGVFTTGTIDHNMTQHFLREGYTVWLLDHRLSNRLPYNGENHTIDDVARFDVAAAIRHVYDDNGSQPVNVFAHCVGGAAFSMAVLRGNAWDTKQSPPVSMVRAAIVHAVHPWVVPSLSNRISAALAALYKDLLPGDVKVDPIPPRGTGTALDEVVDRLAATIPWPDDERTDHERNRLENVSGYAVCNRMTLFYGREWLHRNLDPRTHDELRNLVGVGGIEVFRQLFFMLLRKRLTDRMGENNYVTQTTIGKYWRFPTLFAHGSDNTVFDVRSAVQSWNRLAMVHDLKQTSPRPFVGLFVPEKRYGHMDFLFGKDAHREVYPQLTDFLHQQESFQSRVQGVCVGLEGEEQAPILVNGRDVADYISPLPRKPICGPMVQVQQDGGVRKLVLWFEQGADATSDIQHPEVKVDDHMLAKSEFGCVRSEASGAGVCWLITIPETDTVKFDHDTRIRFQLRYHGGVPAIGAEGKRHRHARAGAHWGNYNNRIDLDAADARALAGAFGGTPLNMKARTPIDDPAWHEIRLAGFDWWRHWAVHRGGPRPVTAFLATSCRWPGLSFERDSLHPLAVPMLRHVDLEGADAAQGLLLLGDQIYVDATANVAETTEPGERGPQRYRDAWNPKAASGALLASVPTWMVVDDHEFGDDLSEYEPDGPDNDALSKGFDATIAFQWRHDPATPKRWPPGKARSKNAAGAAHRGFWYEFHVGGIPAFAADTRTERRPRGKPQDWRNSAIMGNEQATALEAWLLAHANEPKLLCSGSVFGVPARKSVDHNASRRHADDWCGYPASCERLVNFIVDNGITNVIFVSGDYHLSAMASLRLEANGKHVDAVSVVSSGWNATLPFANAHEKDFYWDQQVQLASGASRVFSRASLLSTASRQFSKITMTRVGTGCDVKSEVFNEAGVLLKAMDLQLR